MAARTKTKVSPKYKTKYRVKNWPAYDLALRNRGDITVWISDQSVCAWNAPPNGRPGGQRKYALGMPRLWRDGRDQGEIHSLRAMQQRLPCGIPNLMDKTEGPTSQSRSGQITNCNTTLLETICDDRMWCESGSVFPSYVECRRFQALYEVLKRIRDQLPEDQRSRVSLVCTPDPRMPEHRLRLRAFSMPGVKLEDMVAIPGTQVIMDGSLIPSEAPGFGQDIDKKWVEAIRV